MLTPGPDFAITMRNSLVYSRRSGFFAALGITSGMMMHVTYTLLGLGILISQSDIIMNIVQFLGASYLFYIGFQAIKQKPRSQEDVNFEKAEQDITRFQAWKNGFLSNSLNPMVIILFVSILSGQITDSTPVTIQVLYGVEIFMISLAWFGLVAFLFSIDIIRSLFARMGHWLDRVTGSLLIFFAARLTYMLAKVNF